MNLALGEDNQNFMLVEGTEPGTGLRADTKLIGDCISTFIQKYDKANLTVQLPDFFNHL